jgi:hypothetical protein
MTIRGNFYNSHGVLVGMAFARIINVSGGVDGWTGTMGVYQTNPDVDLHAAPLLIVQLNAAYVESEHPFVSIYAAAALNPSFSQMSTVNATTKKLTRLEFMQRFTATERAKIYGAAIPPAAPVSSDPAVMLAYQQRMMLALGIQDYLKQLEAASYVDIMRPDTRGGVFALENYGLLDSPGRAAQVLALN